MTYCNWIARAPRSIGHLIQLEFELQSILEDAENIDVESRAALIILRVAVISTTEIHNVDKGVRCRRHSYEFSGPVRQMTEPG